jgi:hypothetical protein
VLWSFFPTILGVVDVEQACEGRTIASYVAYTKETLLIENIEKEVGIK